MRQHVNPLSKYFYDIEPIPPIKEIFSQDKRPIHLDIGCGSGAFLFDLANQNKNWNYIGLEIREKLVDKAKLKLENESIDNLFFAFGNASYLIDDFINNCPGDMVSSVSFNFPDPWFKKKHHKRRIIQPELIYKISQLMKYGGLISIKSDVEELFKYMDMIIMNSKSFITFNCPYFEIIEYYNPTNLQTNRENYVRSKKLKVFEKLYKKI